MIEIDDIIKQAEYNFEESLSSLKEKGPSIYNLIKVYVGLQCAFWYTKGKTDQMLISYKKSQDV